MVGRSVRFNFTGKSKASGVPRRATGAIDYRIAVACIGLVRISTPCTASERAVRSFAASALRQGHWHAACVLEVPPLPHLDRRIQMKPAQTRPHFHDIEAMVDANAAALGLTIDAEHRAGVLINFERIANLAQTVMEFPLGEEVELAPVFSHDRP